MISHHPAKVGGHRHCGSGDMFLADEEENSRYSRFSPRLLFISKGHELKAHGIYHFRSWSQALIAAIEQFENNFCQSKSADENEKEKREKKKKEFF